MNDIKNICVYSASSTKIDPIYFEAAEELGKILAQKHINLINGAGCLGLMCRISDAALAAGGTVTVSFPVHGGTRLAPQRTDPTDRDGKHARTQTTYGRFVRRSDCPARGMRYTGRATGNHYLETAWTIPETHRHTEYQRIL